MQNIKFVGTPIRLLNEELVSSVLINFATYDGHKIDTLEYNFIEMPLSVGIEAKPYIDLFGRDMFHFEPVDIAFTVKYLF